MHILPCLAIGVSYSVHGGVFGFAYPWALLSRVHCLDKRSPLSVTLKSTDGWGISAYSMMLMYKSALEVSFSCVHDMDITCVAFFIFCKFSFVIPKYKNHVT